MNKVLYLIGSLRNERIPKLANLLRERHPDFEVFDEWYSAGPEADDSWKDHQQFKGLTYAEALEGHAARNVFAFDKRHLDRASHALLVLPAGKSGHMEVMYATYGVRARTAILLDPEDVRWDVMYQFVPDILNNDEEVSEWLNRTPKQPAPSTTKANQGSIFSLDRRYVASGRSWGSGQNNTEKTTGGKGSNTRDLLGPLSGTY
jgi:hypothetical protein